MKPRREIIQTTAGPERAERKTYFIRSVDESVEKREKTAEGKYISGRAKEMDRS